LKILVPVLLLLASVAVAEEAPQTQAAPQTQRQRAVRIAASLDDAHLAGQVIMAGIDANGPLSAGERRRLGEVQAGAVMLFKKNLDTDTGRIKAMLDEARALLTLTAEDGAAIPPFIACDHEGGAVHRFGANVERLPAPQSYWEKAATGNRAAVIAEVRADALRGGRQLSELGINMNLAPIAEVLDGRNALFLGSRSYGPDAGFVTDAAAAFIAGMREAGVSCVLKHFPGNSSGDPHQSLPILAATAAELRGMTAPFAALIKTARPAAVMVSHVVVTAWDAGRSASLSPEVIQKRLRAELGFSGIIIADDFSMGALAGLPVEEAAVTALAAGADMVMAWPATLSATRNAILAAVQNGRLKRERLRDAAEHIIYQKLMSLRTGE
jgi:beta-N-acetylhexosaminidase